MANGSYLDFVKAREGLDRWKSELRYALDTNWTGYAEIAKRNVQSFQADVDEAKRLAGKFASNYDQRYNQGDRGFLNS